MRQKKDSLLEIHDLSVSFQMYEKGIWKKRLQVISNLHLTVYPGEMIAVAGASGSGKSLLASAVLGILPENAMVEGHIHYKGEELTKERQGRLIGNKIAYVPQSVSFLDPLMKIGKQVEGHQGAKMADRRKLIFERLGLPEKTKSLYPFQLSGGMARRALAATAFMSDAELIIADEPTPGMGRKQALETMGLFQELAAQKKAVILITHDLELAVEFATRVAVFYAGTTVEAALSENFKSGGAGLRHPYSRALWKSLPQNGFEPIKGYQPYPESLPAGCLYSPRCPYKTEKCTESVPPMKEIRGGLVRCYYAT